MSASPSEQILTKIAAKNDSEVVELPALYDTIDPEKLDAVVQSMDDGSVSFSYAGYDVTATSEAEITISDPALAKQS